MMGKENGHIIGLEGSDGRLEVEEFDQAGNVVATYIASGSGSGKRGDNGIERGVERIDVVIPKRTSTWAREFLYAFLPVGYPHSVTSDYLEYQIYDSLQAFSSSIASLLASRAVLEGVGVGDAEASPTTALFLSILQSSVGQLTTILFAHRLGTALEPECKMYRLLADIFNDFAMILDCFSPLFSKSRTTRAILFGFSSILRALCGVSAGSSKASLSAHFAKWGNLGELNAKDLSQETVISLFGMLAGSVVVSFVSSRFATWSAMIFLIAVHLGMNYMAVRAVSMRTLNRQRANIVFSHFLFSSILPQNSENKETAIVQSSLQRTILTPIQVSEKERIFEQDGVLRWNGTQIYGSCSIGVDLQSILREMSKQNPNSKSFTKTPIDPQRLIKSLETRGYFLWYSPMKSRFLITFSTTSTVKTQLLAWFHALLTAREIHDEKTGVLVDTQIQMTEAGARGSELIRRTLFAKTEGAELGGQDFVENLWEFLDVMGAVAEEKFEVLQKGLEEMGWDLENGALETRSGTRVKVMESVGRDGEKR